MIYCFFIAQNQEERTRKMKNIEEKILMAEEEIKQLQNKRKNSSVSRKRRNEKREIDGFMKKAVYLKVSLLKAKN